MSLLASWLRRLRLGSSRSTVDPCPCQSHDSIAIVEKADLLPDQSLESRSEEVQRLVRAIADTHAELLTLPDLRPGKAINHLLGNLVSVCSEIHDRDVVEKVLAHPDVQSILPSLRQLCADAESCLELHWAEHILGSQADAHESSPDAVLARLKTFPYYDNYEELTRLELCAILSATKTPPRRVAFMGSGPLPLTSLCLLQALKRGALVSSIPALSGPQEEEGKEGEEKDESTAPVEPAAPPVVLNVDHDAAAIEASLRLSLALGEAGRGMEFVCAEAAAAAAGTTATTAAPQSPAAEARERDLAEFDVVYVAALVGASQAAKEDIVLRVAARMRPGALLVVRSSWGLRTCLYPEVDLATERLLPRLEPG
ncbi:14b1815c-b390-4f59-8ecf-722ee587f229 [Thermothielavioides terrestris]|uniref:14b1815c-b390-4f59-8ecf-722ee587f229 n=1 Tax=Thermothielavioides terrestris TaxID=2587410 RepID=A0A446BE92_9PEZI|nr:14b1815c-b390-4f59-8ecf-722ee587f229 [Thermothielavioides terrestris]